MPRLYKRPKTSKNITNIPDTAEGDIMEEQTNAPVEAQDQPIEAEGDNEVVDWKAKFEAQKEINKKLEARNKEDFQSKRTLEERLQQLEAEAFKKDVELIASTYGVPAKLLRGNNSKEVESYAKELKAYFDEREAQGAQTPTQRFLETNAGRVKVDDGKAGTTMLNSLFKSMYKSQ